jgi:hypothetical protein
LVLLPLAACALLLALLSYQILTSCVVATQPSYEATAKVRNVASKAFGTDKADAPRQKKQKDQRKVGSGFKSKKRFKRR